jgi:AcrR family transcriptional regulator
MADDEAQPSGPPEGHYPPEWIEQSMRDGTPITTWATSSGGAVYLAVWRRFPDATRFEQGLAATPPLGPDPLPMPPVAVARVAALREARPERLDLADDRWQRLVSLVWADLAEAERTDAPTILAAVEAFAPRQKPALTEARGLTEYLIRSASQKVRKRTRRAPTKPAVARELATSESTLVRAMEDLGMVSWPPAPPED